MEKAGKLIAACNRLLATERDVLQMPREQVQWFMSKPGHRDCFTVARALKGLLENPKLADRAADPQAGAKEI